MRRPGGYQDKQLLVAHGVPELLQAAQRRGASLHQLLAGTTLFEADLQKPQFRIHPGALQRLLGNLHKVPSPELPSVIAQAICMVMIRPGSSGMPLNVSDSAAYSYSRRCTSRI